MLAIVRRGGNVLQDLTNLTLFIIPNGEPWDDAWKTTFKYSRNSKESTEVGVITPLVSS